jgi:hypothetical protein
MNKGAGEQAVCILTKLMDYRLDCSAEESLDWFDLTGMQAMMATVQAEAGRQIGLTGRNGHRNSKLMLIPIDQLRPTVC